MIKLIYLRGISFIILSILLFQTLTFGQKISKQTGTKIDSLLNQYAALDAPGFSMAVVRNQRVVYEKSEGYANLENKLPATSATNYRLASVTKQFTALAILQLNQAKKLSVEDEIQQYLPNLPLYAKGIKIKHLLNHISGLLGYEGLIKDDQGMVTDVNVLDMLSKVDSVKFPAGSAYDYSNSGYSLLASIIEKVSGQTYPEYIRSHIFKPLKMNQSSFNVPGFQISNRAYGYTKKDTMYEKTDQSSSSYVLGDGGIYSSVNDLVKWQNALLKSKLIIENPLQQASSIAFDLDKYNKYACGWRIKNNDNMQIYNHTGSSRGFTTYHIFVPEKKLGVIFLSNRIGGGIIPEKIGNQIIDLLLNESNK